MKRCKVFGIPVLLLLFVLLPNIASIERGEDAIADTVRNPLDDEQERNFLQQVIPSEERSYHSETGPSHHMIDKRMGDSYHGYKESHHSGQDMSRMPGMEIHSSYQTFHRKRPYTKSSATNTLAVGWQIKAVDAPKYFNYLSSRAIAVDTSNHSHIAYGGDRLYYACHDGNVWNYQIVNFSPGVGFYSSIAIDTWGKVHISYFDYSNENLKYATNASGSWVTKTVDSGGWVGWYTSLALDSSDKVHISYYDDTNRDLKYARKR
ncbi:MAG: hypothetical protein QY310_00655 [Candidatus Jettenia sp. CY-1]|nr:MAG: hypothetical protein QY310_00655 [Candidatus Jettenia sp. CY-1]